MVSSRGCPYRCTFCLWPDVLYGHKFRARSAENVVDEIRGCPYHCTFCLWPGVLYGHKFRARSAENVVDEIEEAVRTYGHDEIYFDDDTFTISPWTRCAGPFSSAGRWASRPRHFSSLGCRAKRKRRSGRPLISPRSSTLPAPSLLWLFRTPARPCTRSARRTAG